MKDHEYAKIINNLRDTAVSHKDCQSMREALASTARPLIEENKRLINAIETDIRKTGGNLRLESALDETKWL